MIEKSDNDEVMTQLDAELEDQMEKRKKILWRYDVPEERTLLAALATLTKAELDDIRYNLCVQGISSLKKQEMAAALVPAIIDFSHKWMLTIGIEQYNILTHMSRKNGISTVVDMNDVRMDYMRSMGMLFSGMYEGKEAWFLPNDLLNVYASLDNAKFRKEISFNDEASRLATGLLFYYGYLPYDQLHERVNGFLKARKLEFIDFMGIMINAGCWQGNIVALEVGMHYYTVLDPEALSTEQIVREDIEYYEFTYEEVYQAGESEYVEETDAYFELLKFFKDELSLNHHEAVDIVGEILIMILNNEQFNEILEYIQNMVEIPKMEDVQYLADSIAELNDTTHLWMLKGNSPRELSPSGKKLSKKYQSQKNRDNVVKFVPRTSTIGRNDPCPCGSGKKYKKCCLDKDCE
ncbi:MAG: hypothetical protein K0Q53_2669 [Massilibacillus sp.]|jgi:hypothetical protein|nr:hypothetical protein [Massilibacillus sp.]